MIKRMNHTGLMVTNLDNSIRFYRDIIGLDFIRYKEGNGGGFLMPVGMNMFI